MHALVVYFSKFGNTRQVAEAIGEGLEQELSVRLIPADELTVDDLEGVELAVMGAPTHKMNLPEAVRPVFDGLPKRVLEGVAVAAFDTSYKMSGWLNQFTAAKRLARKLRRLGGRQVVRPEIFHVVGREGPLDEGELDRARGWSQRILTHFTGAGA